MMTIKTANLHENEMDISLWGTMRKMYVDIYTAIAFATTESDETYFATAIYKYKEKKWVEESFHPDEKRQRKLSKFDDVKEETWFQIEQLISSDV